MIKAEKANGICIHAELAKFGNIGTFQKIICFPFHHFMCTASILTPADFGWASVEQMRTPSHTGVAFRHGTSLYKHIPPGKELNIAIYSVYFFQIILCKSFLFINMIIRKMYPLYPTFLKIRYYLLLFFFSPSCSF